MRWSRISPRSAALLAVAAAAVMAGACGRSALVSDPRVQQAEARPALPPYPKADDLLPVDLGLPGNFHYFIDPSSISVAPDGVVRYTLVARSTSGAINVSFEGLRCASRERRLYAFGRPDGTWSAARNREWDSAWSHPEAYYATLADYYFCPERTPVADAAEAARALKLGRHPATMPKPY